MKRFNQAWLLNKDNPSVYCCFGLLLGKKGESKEAISFLERSVKMKSDDADFLIFIALVHNVLYESYGNDEYQKKALELLRKGLKLESDNSSIENVIKEISE